MISGRQKHYCCSFDGAVSYLTLRLENTISGTLLMQASPTDISPQNNTYIYVLAINSVKISTFPDDITKYILIFSPFNLRSYHYEA
jgi:hypothetical protein